MNTWADRLLAFLGIVAQPHLRDHRVHDASDKEAVAMAALHLVAKRSEGVMQSIITDGRTDARPQALRSELDRMRATMTEVARRADR